MPVFEAVSQATLEEESSARQASSFVCKENNQTRLLVQSIPDTHNSVRDLVANLV